MSLCSDLQSTLAGGDRWPIVNEHRIHMETRSMVTAQAVVVQPHVFELEGDNARISYSTTSIAGVAELTYLSRDETFSF